VRRRTLQRVRGELACHTARWVFTRTESRRAMTILDPRTGQTVSLDTLTKPKPGAGGK
jgi:hypothetical protein